MHDELSRLKEENERLTKWVNDLQSGMYINCVYCGHRYGPKETTPASMADVLKQHIEVCSAHPMSRLKKAYEKLARPWKIRLAVPVKDEPFRQLECEIIDIGHADHCLLVRCTELYKELTDV